MAHQQQYYDQGAPPQAHQQQQRYDDSYDYGYEGYEQGNYEQWDKNGYHDQQQEHVQNSGQGRGYMNGQMGQPPQGRLPPPRDQYAQDMYQQPHQGRGPPGRPMPPGGGPPRGGLHPRGRGMNMPPPGQRLPRSERALMSPTSPMSFPQDNAFPSFPSQNPKDRPGAGSMDEAMALMNIGNDTPPQGRSQGPPKGRGMGMRPGPQNRGPPPGRRSHDHPDISRHDSGMSDGMGRGQHYPQQRAMPPHRQPPVNMDSARGPPQQRYNPSSPTQQGVGLIQRSMTMPQNLSGDHRSDHDQQQWGRSGPAPGYRGPNNIPPRPSTASGTKNDSHARMQQYEQQPPMPQMTPAHQNYPHQPHHQEQLSHDDGDLDNLYNDYYDEETPGDRTSKATSIDMPDFDNIQESNTRHRRGFSIEGHLAPAPQANVMQGIPPAPSNVNAQHNDFYQQAAKSQSQPNLEQYSDPRDVPAVPALPSGPSGPPPSQDLPNAPQGRGPPTRGMTMDSMPPRGPSNQGYSAGVPFNADPMSQQPLGLQRGYSGESAYSEPGQHLMRNGSPMVPRNPIARPGTAAPAPGRMPSDPVQRRPGTTQPTASRPMNPDALPAHPAPQRQGLAQQQPQSARPPPMRQYNSDPPPAPAPAVNSRLPSEQRRDLGTHPVTHDELNRLRNTVKANPSDSATGLQLAKKLVEAANVLIDEGGTADTRTRNKNREKFVMEAHKVVKKLVSGGSPDAMFYLADCYGRGRLGLAVDAKEAFTLYQSAAKAGHAASAYRTAVCCEMGNEEGGGTKKDLQKAVQWYRRAAALGDAAAMYKIGMILLKGLLGQQPNLGEAINMLKRSADLADEENPHALHELALLYEQPNEHGRIIPDERYAAQLFLQAAELGYKFSQFRLGQAFEYGMLGYAIDARSSIAWYTRAASQEEHQSELALSGWYLTGSTGILEQSDTEAYLWARKAACAEPALPKALFAMGYFTEVGIGCPRSLEEAKRWYGRAAAYKFPKAQERLEELKKGGAKAQRGRERLSRTNQKQHEENCTVM